MNNFHVKTIHLYAVDYDLLSTIALTILPQDPFIHLKSNELDYRRVNFIGSVETSSSSFPAFRKQFSLYFLIFHPSRPHAGLHLITHLAQG